MTKLKSKSTSSYTITLYIACKLTRAKKRNTEVIKQKATEEKEGILSTNNYLLGGFVHMD